MPPLSRFLWKAFFSASRGDIPRTTDLLNLSPLSDIMRIPWYFCLLLMVSAVGITWVIRTRGMDFMPEGGTVTIVQGERRQSEVFAPTIMELVGPPAPEPVDAVLLQEEPVIIGIDHYATVAQATPDRLLRAYDVLRAQGQTDLAYLAGERLLESTALTDAQKREMASTQIALHPDIPPYVYDTREVKAMPVTLVGIPSEDQASLTAQLTVLIEQSSGGLVDTAVTYKWGESPSLRLDRAGDSIQAALTSADVAEVVSTLYILLVTEMNKSGFSLPLWQGATLDEASVALTRRAWQSLYAPPAVVVEQDATAPAVEITD